MNRAKNKTASKFILRDWHGLIALFAVLVVFFFKLWALGYEYASPDKSNASGTNAIAEALYGKGNEMPWNPAVFCGLPAFESLQYVSNVYFPGYVLQFCGKIYFVFYFVAAAYGVFLICRHLGLSWLPSLFAGASFGLSPWLVGNYAFGHGSQAMAAAFIPLAFLFTLKLFRDKNIWIPACALALTLGFQMQRGHTQISYYTFLLIGLAALFLAWDADQRKKRLALLAGALVFAGLIALNLYMPLKMYLPFSTRAGGAMTVEYASAWSMNPLELITAVLPDFYGFGGRGYSGYFSFTEFPYFVGIVPVGLALWGLWEKRRERVAQFLGVVMFLSMLIAFGKYTPVYSLFYNFLPYFKSFRVPVMIFILVYLSVAVLSAYGLETIRMRFKLGGAWAIGLFAFGFIQLWLVDSRIGFIVKAQQQQTQIVFKNFGIERIHVLGAMFQNSIGNQLGFEMTGGYHAAKLANYQDFVTMTRAESNPTPQFLALTASNLVLSPILLSLPNLIFKDSLQYGQTPLYLYQSNVLNPRAFTVGSYIVSDKPVQFEPRKTALLKESLPFEIKPDSTASAKILNYKPDGCIIQVECREPQLLVLCDAYYPRWKATLDGEPTKIYETNFCFRGVAVPPGKHGVIFFYDTRIIDASKYLSFAATIAVITVLLSSLLSEREKA